MCLWSKTYTNELKPVRERILNSGQMKKHCALPTHSHLRPPKKLKTSSNPAQPQQAGWHSGVARQARHPRLGSSDSPKARGVPRDQPGMTGQEQTRSTHPTLNTSASFRNAELIRMGNGYFWKSLGKRTTASHCSPSLPDLRPKGDSRN